MSAVLQSDSPLVAIRPMRQEDVPSVLDIERAAYDFPWTEGIFRDCLRVGYSCWILEVDGVAFGYGVLAVAAGEAHLLNLCIDPQEQRKGWGTRLLRRMLGLARWHEARLMFLEVRPTNLAAISVYEQFGFRVIGIRPGYYRSLEGREDAVVMALKFTGRTKASA